MAIFARNDGNGNVTIYGASAVSDGQGHVTLLEDEYEVGDVIAEDEVSLALVDTSEYATHSEIEQTAESISLAVVEVEERVTVSESRIEQLADSISSMVRTGDETSLVKQDANGLFYFDISAIQEAADATSSSLSELLKSIGDIGYEDGETLLGNLAKMESALESIGVKTEYIGQSTYEADDGNEEPCLVLGETDSQFKLLVTNKRIVFIEGSTETTYIKDNTLVTNNVEVKHEIRQGRWMWKARTNGNLGLAWIGGDE